MGKHFCDFFPKAANISLTSEEYIIGLL